LAHSRVHYLLNGQFSAHKSAGAKLIQRIENIVKDQIITTYFQGERCSAEGLASPYTRHLVEEGFDVVGVDLSEEMVRMASSNVPGAAFAQLSMSEIDYRDEFDGVISSFSILLLSPALFKETASRVHTALVDGALLSLVERARRRTR
jgi:hypothetical protein